MTTRRGFLAAAGGLALGALLARPREAAGAPRTIELEAREVTWELAPGKTIKAMAYNGQVPGPEIRAREGERLRVVVTNALGEPTTVHWHGVDVPNAMDGVPDVTQRPVPPGARFVYEFEARPAGTRWYHTHFDEPRQLDLGLAAPLVIEPAREPLACDRELTLVLDDWATGTGAPVPDTDAGVAGARGTPRLPDANEADEPKYDVMTINGKAYPATEPLHVTPGERLRLRLVNASAEHTHVVRLAGHRLRVTHTDGNPLLAPVEVDALPIAPAERYDVLVIADRPGAWFLHCAQPGHAEAGERMLVGYVGHARATPAEPEPGVAGLTLWDYGLGRGRSIAAAGGGAARTVVQTLAGGLDGSEVWTVNGKRYPDTEGIRGRQGERLRITLRNESTEAHPMHLHGQSFRLLAANGRRYAEPLVKDVVDVAPDKGSALIEVIAANPGDWLFHCHKPMHMMGGMASLLKVR